MAAAPETQSTPPVSSTSTREADHKVGGEATKRVGDPRRPRVNPAGPASHGKRIGGQACQWRLKTPRLKSPPIRVACPASPVSVSSESGAQDQPT